MRIAQPFTGHTAKKFVKFLKEKGFRVVKVPCRLEWHVNGNGFTGNLIMSTTGSYNANFFLDPNDLYCKPTKCMLRINIFNVNLNDLEEDMKFMLTEEGLKYNRSFDYLEDDFCKLKTTERE